jgi:gluconate 2-dehydrogenase gamma chain
LAQLSRRRFLQLTGAATGAGLLGWRLPALATAGGGFLTPAEVTTLNAALARMIPASGVGDWSAADLGVAAYIDNILSAAIGDASAPPVFAGGPYRAASSAGPGFSAFQQLSRVKAIGWTAQINRWQALYRSGLAGLDKAAGGDFASAPSEVQDGILEELDTSNDPFFAVLYDHTMEGAYSHPVYGGNAGYRSWQSVGFGGDVHGVRFPSLQYSRGAWNVYGGYAPEEILAVGSPSTEQPVTSSTARRLS